MSAKVDIQADEDLFEANEMEIQIGILLIYEDRATGMRARCALDRVLSRLELMAEGHVTAWSLDSLRNWRFQAQATRDASDADILALSIHGNNPLAPEVTDCLRQWVGLRRSQPCALVISLDTGCQAEGELAPALAELCSEAAGNGMTILLQFGDPQSSEMKAVTPNIEGRADSTSQVPETVLHRPSFYRQWGINE